MSKTTPGQLAIQRFNDGDVGRYDMLTMQQAHDLASHILANPEEILGKSLLITNLKSTSEVEAQAIRTSYKIPDTNPTTRIKTSTSDSLMDRSFCISSFQNSIDETSANKDIIKEILKFIGSQDQEKISFALCSAPRLIRNEDENGEIWLSSEGDTHWTSLHVRKIKNQDGTQRIEFFYADSIATRDIPAGIKNAIAQLNSAIIQINSKVDAQRFLADQRYIELEGGIVNDTNQLIINGLAALGGANYQLPTNATPVKCANQGSSTSGYRNTCCENALFNMFTMHYTDDFLESQTLSTSTGETYHDKWDQFIANARPTLQAIIEERREEPSLPTGSLQSGHLGFSKQLREIDITITANLDQAIEKVNKLKDLRMEVARHLSKVDASDQKIHTTLEYINQSLSQNLEPLILHAKIPDTSIKKAIDILDKYNHSGLEEQNDVIDELTKFCKAQQVSTSPATPTDPESPAATKAITPIPPSKIPELNALENKIITERAYQPPATAAKESILPKVSNYFQNLNPSPGNPDREELLRPRTYSGIGAATKMSYSQESQRYEFTITQIFEGGLASQMGLEAGQIIAYEDGGKNNPETLKEAVNGIRKLAELRANKSAPTALKRDLDEKIKLLDAAKIPLDKQASDLIDAAPSTPTAPDQQNKILIHDRKTFNDPAEFTKAIQFTAGKIRAQKSPTAPSAKPTLPTARPATPEPESAIVPPG